MEIKCANYDGSWDTECEYCGKPQQEHQTHLGDLNGIRHISRLPCEQEKYEIRKRAVKQGIVLRSILLFYNTATYLWGLIPFKEEVKLLWQAIKHIYVSTRAIIILKKKRPK